MQNKVKERRKELGLRQEDLAALSQVSRSTISEIESDKHMPGVDVAILLARALQCQVEDLFFL